ncbi:universal stress protein [Cohaesibacter celericrescens]|uniref:Universal stress protein n=1 Tax=Cohaesibacter celericrescens TaxID=2067669 RepID=A0A2N5XME4_9HYPH|nr:universal stress protein [Cohaesibacter celericrescens]PLW75696.1 universal stress protein [Cohaesibacter celericrescens]
MYKNILVPIALDHDHSPTGALEAVKALADDTANIILLHVFDIVPAYVASQVPPDVRKEARKYVLDELEAIAKTIPNATVASDDGNAGTVIVDYAEEHDVDLIVVASHRPGMQDYFLGSTAARVVRHAPCSVHVIR